MTRRTRASLGYSASAAMAPHIGAFGQQCAAGTTATCPSTPWGYLSKTYAAVLCDNHLPLFMQYGVRVHCVGRHDRSAIVFMHNKVWRHEWARRLVPLPKWQNWIKTRQKGANPQTQVLVPISARTAPTSIACMSWLVRLLAILEQLHIKWFRFLFTDHLTAEMNNHETMKYSFANLYYLGYVKQTTTLLLQLS